MCGRRVKDEVRACAGPAFQIWKISFVGAVVIGLLSVCELERKYLQIIDTLEGKQGEARE